MRKSVKLYILLGVLVAVCAAVVLVSRHETKVEQIKNSGEVILEIETDTVTNLAWTNDQGTYSFTRDTSWRYDDDEAFPVDDEALEELLEQFQSFVAAFTIEDVEDYSQYGLDEPVCTISITANDQTYTLELGDFSTMDEQRYISLGDGCAYLAEHDPLDEFDIVATDLILNDSIPDFDTDTVQTLAFTGTEEYTITRSEDTPSICADDVYFTDGNPLDASLVETYLSTVAGLSLTDFVTYNVTDEELETYGLTNPDLTITVDYEGDDEVTASFTLSISRNPEEQAAYEEAVEAEESSLPSVTCYARLDDSAIVYEITSTSYSNLTDVAYDTLRHQKVYTGDFSNVTSVDITLDGESYTFTYEIPESEDEDEDETEETEGVWKYQDTEFDIYSLRSTMRSLTVTEFTSDESDGEEEINIVLHMDDENFPTYTLTLYRHNGSECLACVDGTPVAYVSRTQAVDIVEAVNSVILDAD